MVLLLGLLALVAAPILAIASQSRLRADAGSEVLIELGLLPEASINAVDQRAAAAARLARFGRYAVPNERQTELATLIQRAGLSWKIDEVIAGKVIGVALGLFLGFLVATSAPALGLGMAAVVGGIGWFGPDTLLDRRARERGDAIRKSLPDALDLLAISVEAGVGFESALASVAADLKGPLSDELNRALQQMRLGLSRREALMQLKARASCRELSTFILALLQADALGISIGQILRTQASEMRALRRRMAREQAAKTPVKILFPLVFGIFPALLIIILGPAALKIVETLG